MQDKFWTPELWCEFLEGYSYSSGIDLFKAAEQFKSSKSPKKEWEIVAFRVVDTAGNYLYHKCKDGRFRQDGYPENEGYLAEQFNKEGETIHSVRRLSDGEVFSVGDRITTILYKEGIKIKHFEIKGDRLFCYHDEGHFYADGQHYYFSQVKKLPQPILTTVDGVEKFEGDKMYVVFDDFRAYQYSVNEKVFTDLKENKKAPIIAFCSTSKAAEEWKLQNKPLLSLNDVKEVIGKNSMQSSDEIFLSLLTTLVKQKLNQ